MSSRKKEKEFSQEEIAKQFLLPERQSKIATLLKQDGQAYCICRSSDSSRFMIGCDSCEEWYHGDCINITEKESKLIKQFFCVRCCDEDPTLQTKWKTRKRDDSLMGSDERKAKRRKERNENSQQKSGKSSSKRCGQCMGCYRTDDCGRCDVCKDMKKHGGHSRLKLRCKHRACVNTLQYNTPQAQKQRRKRRDSSSDGGFGDSNAHLQTDYARQCYGPGCLSSARYGSKYCGDVCGNKLATNRIYQVLPQRIQEWALSPCSAEEKNKQTLELIRKQQLEVRQILKELDNRHKELDVIVERARHASIDPNYEQDIDDELEMSTYCITCGHEIHARTAIRHMEKCFNKFEAQASFGSIYKTKIEGSNMFCDFFNVVNHTYCKRLRVLCPEHSKDSKITDDEVCGCPLVTNVFDLTGDFCRVPKKSCVKHYVWEKLRRAEVDMERVRQWLKFDELLEQERQIRHNMASRAGVLSLMLHSTYNHEIMEQLTKATQQDQPVAQEEITKKFKRSSGGKKGHK